VKKNTAGNAISHHENDCPTSLTSKRVMLRIFDELEQDNKEIRDKIYKAMSHVKPD